MDKSEKLITLYRKLKPGECPFCGKGPISVIVEDKYPVILDTDGYAMCMGDVTNRAYGICTNCKKVIGEFELNLFRWNAKTYAFKEKIQPEPKPAFNFFGDTGNQKVIYS